MNLNLTKNNVKYGMASVNTASQSQRSIFEAVLLLVVAALLYFFIVMPKQAELQAHEETRSQLEAEKQTLMTNRRLLEDQVSTLKSHAAEVAKLDEALPIDGRETKAYMLFEDMAAKSGMTLSNLSVTGTGERIIAGNPELIESPFKANRALVESNVLMSVSGTFEQFLGLLSRIETSGRIIDLTGVDITASTDTSLSFMLTLKTYSYE